MASIALPALSVRPPESPLDQYQKVLALQALRQRMQTGQIEQTGALQEQQLRQLQIQDQQTLRSSAKGLDWSQPDTFDKWIQNAQQSGVSPQTLSQLALQRATYKEQLAKTDQATLSLEADKTNKLLGHIDAIKSVTDPAKRAQVAADQANQILSANLVTNPQQSQMLQAIASGQHVPTDDELASFENGLVDHKTQVSQALEERKTAATEWKSMEGLGVLVNTRTGEVKSPAGAAMTPAMLESKYVNIQQKKAGGQALSGDEQSFSKAYEHMKTLVPAFNFNLQAGGLAGETPLNPKQQATAQAILEGRMTPPSSFALKTPYWQNVMGAVFQQDPQFSEQRAELRKNYTVGPQSKEINAINTAMGHVGALSEAVDALNNGNIVALNRIANLYNVQVGDTPVTTFRTIVNRVGPEIAKAYVGAGGSAEERGTTEKDFDPSLSPAQLKSNIGITASLLRSKIASLENQWDQNKSDAMPSFQDRFIMPAAKQALDKLAPQKGGAAAGAAGGLKVGDTVSIKGKQMTVTAVHPDGSFDAK